jgi:Phage integrase family
VNYLIAEAAARAGLPPVHPHMLRHSCGFSLANRGYDLRLIQDYLGHRDPKHTVHYTRVAAGRFEGLWVESGRFHAEGEQTFTVLERWAFLSIVPEERRDPNKPIVYVVAASAELEQQLVSQMQAGQVPPARTGGLRPGRSARSSSTQPPGA